MAWVVSVLAYGDGSYDDDYIVRFFNNHRSARAWGFWRASLCVDDYACGWVYIARV